jgi:acyl carrier protein
VRKKEQVWSIGIYAGPSPVELKSLDAVSKPVLTGRAVTDVPALSVVHPFMVRAGGTWHMFFEVMNRRTHKGEIGLAVSGDGASWTYQRIVLGEPFDLSYPYVFESAGEFYIIPGSAQTGSVRLYRAVDFPCHWAFVGTLIEGEHCLNPSPFRYGERWWMFAHAYPHTRPDRLRLYFAEQLAGPWRAHPQTPIDPARSAGRVVVLDGTVIRYAQDCEREYGTQVRALAITELTATRYREDAARWRMVLAGAGTGWNSSGMHHLDPHQLDDGTWMACVDGWTDGEAWLVEKIGNLLSATFELPSDFLPVGYDTNLAGLGVGLDSLDALRLVAALEKEFDIIIDETELTPSMFQSVGSLTSLVWEKL